VDVTADHRKGSDTAQGFVRGRNSSFFTDLQGFLPR
jgi:hypothetical protein